MNRLHLLILVFGLGVGLVACGHSGDDGAATADGHRRVPITVDGTGFHPDRIEATAGTPITLVFTRVTDQTCAREVIFRGESDPHMLPLNHAVEIPVTPQHDIDFHCAMEMMHGTIVARAH